MQQLILSTRRFLVPAMFSIVTLSACGNSESQEAAATETATEVAAPAGNDKIRDLHWLAGWWQQVTPEGTIFEKWERNEDGSMTGSGGFIKGTDTMVSETIALQVVDNVVQYIPTVKDQNNGAPVPFKLTYAAADSFLFENPGHDFPDKITYKHVDEQHMTASISGSPGGKAHVESFEMTRVQ
jgi:hypothetical protein